MSDNITLPREVVKLALDALEWSWGGEPMGTKELAAITALRTHLAAPRLEVTVDPRLTAEEAAAISAALAAEQPKPSEDVEALRRDAERYRWLLGWLVRTGLLSCKACRIDTPESYGNWWILRKPWSIDDGSFVAYGADLRDAIDAAMKRGDKT